MQVYAVLQMLDEISSTITSQYGYILQMDSTKKQTKKNPALKSRRGSHFVMARTQML